MKNNEKYEVLFKSASELRQLICSKKKYRFEISNLELENN